LLPLDSPRSSSWAIRLRGDRPLPSPARTIRIGILGLGNVGQAVATLAADRSAVARVGLRFRVEQALVRDVDTPRTCPRPLRLTSTAAAFLRGQYDVVIEALDGVEPARTLVARLLLRGTPVVTANKALVAAHGAELQSMAAAHNVAFRYEATALSAVPFLGTLAARPLVASVERVLAIVNGTSNYLLESMAESGASFREALALAQKLGYAEPDSSRDLDGRDAADKLLLLTWLFGWGRLSRQALDVTGIRRVTPDDLSAARSLGGTIKAVVSAERDETGVRAFVGPAFLKSTEPLASLGGALNGIRLDGRHVRNLFFSGPGAGPGDTAATLLDDAVQAACERRVHATFQAGAFPVYPASPATPWFIRVSCPGVLPSPSATSTVVSSAGLPVEQVAGYATHNSRWLLIGPKGRRDVDAAIAALWSTHRIRAVTFRRL
jgi:homoserine dehydrogenase